MLGGTYGILLVMYGLLSSSTAVLNEKGISRLMSSNSILKHVYCCYKVVTEDGERYARILVHF